MGGNEAAEGSVLTPLLDLRRFTLETALAAHHSVESGTAAGKIVVDVTTWFRLRGRDIK